jgi:hypothetical protein
MDTTSHENDTPADTEREWLLRAALAEKDSLQVLIDERPDWAADIHRGRRRRLRGILNGEPLSFAKLRKYFEESANDRVWEWLQDPADVDAEYAADLFLTLLHGEPTRVQEEHRKVVAEIREGVGRSSGTHDNVSTRIVRRQYRR